MSVSVSAAAKWAPESQSWLALSLALAALVPRVERLPLLSFLLCPVEDDDENGDDDARAAAAARAEAAGEPEPEPEPEPDAGE